MNRRVDMMRRKFTRDKVRADVFDYSERFYNLWRLNSKQGYLSRIEFKDSAMA